MKVKYIKIYTDEFGDTYEPCWVAEHTDAEGERRIALGVCEQVNPDTKAFKYKPDAKLIIEECSVESKDAPEPSAQAGPLVVSGPAKKK